MKRFDRHVSALDGSLQQAPEVLAAVGVDVPVNVALGVVNDRVDVLEVKALVGRQRVGVDVGVRRDMVADVALLVVLADVAEHFGANLRRAVLAVTVKQRHNRHVASVAATALDTKTLALGDVHVAASGLLRAHSLSQSLRHVGDDVGHSSQRGDASGEVGGLDLVDHICRGVMDQEVL
jgi:hypothetical protein